MTCSSALVGILVLLCCAILALQLWIITGRSNRNRKPSTPKISPQPLLNNTGSGPKCFRITNVPPGWNKDDLLESLQKCDPSLGHLDVPVSLFPACWDKASQTALLNFKTCPPFFQRIGPDDTTHLSIKDEISDETVVLSVDCHFLDFTPLNKPEGDIVAEFVYYFAKGP
jgi:hypothetical protein